MTSRVTPKLCSLRQAVGEEERCPGGSCPFWEQGGAVLEPGCAIERLDVPIGRRPDLARHLLDLRLRLEEIRDERARADAHRRFSELLNLGED